MVSMAPVGKVKMLEEALRRGWENLFGRLDGPMSFRLIIQPAVAIFLAIRVGLRDARTGRPPFLWTVFSSANDRRELLRQGWKDVGTVFIVALILDSIYQVIVHSGIYTLELLLAASILALLPYALVRGLVTRVARLRGVKAPTKANPEPTQTDGKAPTRETED
jgi:hypothetical protein